MKASYYPGCSLHGTARDYDESVRAVAGLFDIELDELEDWNCCGASSAHMTDFDLGTALSARNIQIAERKGNADLIIPCSACFNRLKTAEEEILHGGSKVAAEFPIQGSVKALTYLDYILENVSASAIAEKVIRPLEGLKVACYYGCLSLRPPKITGNPDHEDPKTMETMMELLGCDVVNWSFKTDCCGGALALGRTDAIIHLAGRILDMADEAGAECLVAVCPMCQANLDTRQKEISAERGRDVHLPVYYFTELMGLAMGHPDVTSWLKRHIVDPIGLLSSKRLV